MNWGVLISHWTVYLQQEVTANEIPSLQNLTESIKLKMARTSYDNKIIFIELIKEILVDQKGKKGKLVSKT